MLRSVLIHQTLPRDSESRPMALRPWRSLGVVAVHRGVDSLADERSDSFHRPIHDLVHDLIRRAALRLGLEFGF